MKKTSFVIGCLSAIGLVAHAQSAIVPFAQTLSNSDYVVEVMLGGVFPSAVTEQGSFTASSLSPVVLTLPKLASGLKNISAQGELQLTINQTSDMLNFVSSEDVADVALYDLAGRRVASQKPNAQAFSLSTSTIPVGEVILVVYTADGNHCTHKLLIKK